MFFFKYKGKEIFTKINGCKYYRKRWFLEQTAEGEYKRPTSFFLNNRLRFLNGDFELTGINKTMDVMYVGKGHTASQVRIGGEFFPRNEWVSVPIDFDSRDEYGQDQFIVLGFKFKSAVMTSSDLNDIHDGQSILLLRRYGGLGDILMQSMIFPEIRKRFPNSKITYAIPKNFMSLFDNCSDIDEVIDCSTIDANLPRMIVAHEYDFFGEISTSCIEYESRVLKEKGYVDKSRQEIWSESMGLHLTEFKTCITITEKEKQNAYEDLKKRGIKEGKPIICIAPYSNEKTRSYPSDLTQRLIDSLSKKFQILYMDSSESKSIKNAIQICNLGLREMGAIITNIDLMISVDTGPLHYAGILGKSVIGLFGVTDASVRTKHYNAQYLQGECQKGKLSCWYSGSTQCKKPQSDSATCMYIEPERITKMIEQIVSEGISVSMVTKKKKDIIPNEILTISIGAIGGKNCRICGSTKLHEYLDLGMMPIINKLENSTENARKVKKFPLKVLFCGACGLSQLSYVVDPSELYDYYPYRSSISRTFIEHCRELAEYYCDKFNLTKDDLVVDIASNDGTLLKCFKDLGIKVLGIEPAQNLAKIAEEQGIPTMAKFWDRDCAEIIIEKKFYPSIVFGTNIFAHVHNVHDFIRNAKMILKPVDGRLVLEFPYLPELFNQNAFDTIYHEHLSYFLIHPLLKLCDSQALVISNITLLPIHGGSVRVEFAEKTWNTHNETLNYYLNLERITGFREIENYINWGERIEGLIEEIKSKLATIKEQNKKIAAFGAAAKGNVLLNSIKADSNLINYIVDDTPEKIGKFAPGTGIPIVSREELKNNPPDYLLILPWNFKDEIIANTSDIYKGEYIVALPIMEVVSKLIVKKISNRIKKICITTTFDKRYKEAGHTLFKSIRQHTDCTGIDFKVITSDVDVLKELGKENCHFITEDIKARYSNVKYSKELPAEKYSSSWYRYEIFNMTDYDRVICIDSDCICVEDISYLFSEELNQYDLISVEDHIVSKCFSKLVPELERQGLRLANLSKRTKEGKKDIQPALLVANKSIINNKWYNKLLTYANTAPFSYSIDEGILNDFIYMENLKIKLLPLEWDYQDIYETVCPEVPVPSKPIIVHCQESKPFKKLKTQIEKPFHKWHDLWWKENKLIQ